VDWCDLLPWGFIATIGCIVLGNYLGRAAWKNRVEGQPSWRWAMDPTYLLRDRYYKLPSRKLRFAAMGFLITGALLLLTLAVVLAINDTGTGTICGFAS